MFTATAEPTQFLPTGEQPGDIIEMASYTDSILFPFYLACVSSLLLLIVLLKSAAKFFAKESRRGPHLSRSTRQQPGLRANVRSHGGPTRFLYKILRLILCFALLVISMLAFVMLPAEHKLQGAGKKHWGKKPKKNRGKHSQPLSPEEWLELSLCAFFTYTMLLAILSLTIRPRVRKIINRHLIFLLLSTFAVFVYRNLWPLASFSGVSQDGAAGWITWSRLSILGVAGVVIPLIIPREFVPVNPRNPRKANAEQTASLLSFLLFTYLNPIIFQAYRDSSLPYDSLPPLADSDEAKYLVSQNLPKLDPFRRKGKPRHLFWGLMEVFRGEYVLAAAYSTIGSFAGFISPLSLNALLLYIERRGEGATLRPWVWVAGLFLGPAVVSISWNAYMYITVRALVHTECILTELVFEHALRIRMRSADYLSDTALGASESGSTHITSLPTQGDPTSPNADKTPSSDLVGRINNLISADVENVRDGKDFLLIFQAVAQIAIAAWFLYSMMGQSAAIGMGFLLVTFPLPGITARAINKTQIEQMKRTDGRVQAISETLNVMRMIKLFAWERKIYKQMAEMRDQELVWVKRKKMLMLLNNILTFCLPLLAMVVTFATYTLVMKRELTASRVFPFLAVFDVLRNQLHEIFRQIHVAIQAKVSLDRLDSFLHNTELLDEFTEAGNKALHEIFIPSAADPQSIGFSNTTFVWDSQKARTSTPSRRDFKLRIKGDLYFQKGKINLVVGPTGSGKTSLLLALLGELHLTSFATDSHYNLPRGGGVAYAAQEAWVQNETIRDNILFGQPYDKVRYKKVLRRCALERDLEGLVDGDETEVGEKGVTLSGGQKARITLARAVYSKAAILLLDDVLSALDVHTSRWIVDNCLRGDLIQGRTVILVTHHIALVGPISDFVVSLGRDGRVTSQGTLSDALSKNVALHAQVERHPSADGSEERSEPPREPEGAARSPGRLMTVEEKAQGRVQWPAIKLFLGSLGGSVFWITVIGCFVCSELTMNLQTWFLGYWARQYEKLPPSEVPVLEYLDIYCGLLALAIIAFLTASLTFIFGSIRASHAIHNQLVQSVLGTTCRWLDSTPVGRVIARFTQDLRVIDGPIALCLERFITISIPLLVKLSTVVYMSPAFIIPAVALAVLGGWIGNIYIAAQLPVKREMSNSQSPVFSHFGGAIAGLTSIRAYGAQNMFKQESLRRIERTIRSARTLYNMNRWIGIRMDLLGGLFTTGLAAYLIYGGHSSDASDVGFSLTISLALSSMILDWVRITNDLEVQSNSLERIQDYVAIEQEPGYIQERDPPAYWPSSGTLRVDKLCARYSPDGPNVLHDLSFEVNSGEKIGIVGRTGSGKSSLALSLLRMITTSGTVYYDSVATSDINLEVLRSNITIIPQHPELLSGTLRQNLDPFGDYDDMELNDALRAAGLFNNRFEGEEDRIVLDTYVGSGGSNFSLGQRQIVALARAIVRQSKVLILDEATAAIDFETDAWIQNTIRQRLPGATLLIIAHRLQTVADADRVLVLDAGKIVEFESPAVLLEAEGSYFKSLVDESGDKEAIYSMAAKAIA
ncbi:hypothetical protein BOTBODRAFT_155037 [Botryobasidium botryosum FD-172 SS1]|uniref:Uncharacterized protein n=1 Tax=Botryobasidium botryosum (strain FD-172 SS1) TaxID=930990 RepID=A0A067MQJ1_BOTB1|nr:hypothetical protein BOTBODRAFT_155037 [Botryobasidium botryosum FD-172 SS1]